MTVQITMPALSPTMEEGKLAQWLVTEGDKVSAGDILAEIETDKAVMELEAIDEGVVGKLLYEASQTPIKVNEVIAILLEEGEDQSALDNLPPPSATDAPVTDAPATEKPISEDAPATPTTSSPSVTPPPVSSLLDPTLPEGTEMQSLSVREALRDAMAEEMHRDQDIFIMGEEVAEYQGAYKVTQNLLQEFGARRVIDTPITEHGFAGLGVGAAMAGLRPIIEFMTFNFAMQAIDQIINSAAKTHYMSGGQISCPIVFRGPNGAASRVAAQHSQDYSAWYAHIPGLIVLSPYSAADAKGLLKAAIRSENPVVFLEHELLYGETGDVPLWDDYVLPIGKARVIQAGSDVTLVSYSRGVSYCLDAAKTLATLGIEAEIIDLRSLRPLDMDTVLASVHKTHRLVTVEEGWPVCSIGHEIAAHVQAHGFDMLDAPIASITGADVPMPYAANLEKLALPEIDNIVAAVKQACYK